MTQVSAFVEASLGWQVTDGAGLPAVARLVAVGHVPQRVGEDGGSTESDVPTVALVGPDDDPVAAASLGRSVDAVVDWPGGHDELSDAVASVVGRTRAHRGGDRVLRVAGAAGGVGTSTVALVLAAWLARGGSPTMVVTTGPTPVPDLPVVAPDVVGGHRAWAAARGVPDVPDLRVLGCDGPVGRVVTPRGVRVVVDEGVVRIGRDRPDGGGVLDGRASRDVQPGHERDPDVVVVRRDRAGADAIVDHPGATIVLVDRGPRPRHELAALAGARGVVVVADSARVRRAHERRAIPGSVPGTVLTSLRRVLSMVETAPVRDADDPRPAP